MEGNDKNIRSDLNYESIISGISEFRRSGTKEGSEFNLFSIPGLKYFKLFFYFTNGDSAGRTGPENSSGLLAPTWQISKSEMEENTSTTLESSSSDYKELYNYNSAWAYLTINDEKDRAEQLKSFINLLSNINSESPWYFTELSGLDNALDRKYINEQNFKIEEERQKISIKCLKDSFDDRIGTLLDLYRSIVWSNVYKREVLPANLRKFDMGIYIFESPTEPIHHYEEFRLIKNTHNYSTIDGKSGHKSSYKYIELHNCEFDYNSSKSAFGTFNNAEGTAMEYTIDIFFDDCYEKRFNEWELSNIGDMISLDLKLKYEKEEISESLKTLTNKFANFYENGMLMNMLNEGKSYIKEKGKSALNHIYLGNLFSFSLSSALKYAKGFADGLLIQTGKVIKKKIDAANNRRSPSKSVSNLGNLFKSKTIVNNL